jgi:hypothetical protein
MNKFDETGSLPTGIDVARQRGYHLMYRMNETNYCPGCGRSHWHMGRLSAECAFCGSVLPYEDAQRTSNAITRRDRHTASAPIGRFIVNGRAA